MSSQQSTSTLLEPNGTRMRMPWVVPGSTAYAAAFPTAREAIEAILPSPELKPAITPKGDGLLWVEVVRQPVFAATQDDGQRVVMPQTAACLIGALVTYGGNPNRFSAFGLGRPWSRVGILQLHLPVTLAVGQDSGRRVWHEPAFVADFAVQLLEGGQVRTQVSEGGRRILTLTLPRAGRLSPYTNSVDLFTTTQDRLFRFGFRSRGWRSSPLLAGRRATLELGDHRVAADLANLGVRPNSFFSATLQGELDTHFAAEDIGSAMQVLAPFAGSGAAHGTFTYEAPGLEPVDLFAGMPQSLFTQGAVAG